MSSSAVLRATVRVPKDDKLEVSSPVWNKDGLLSEGEVVSLATRLAAIHKSSAARLAIFAIRDLNDLPPRSSQQLGEFAKALRKQTFPNKADADRALIMAYFHNQQGIEVRVGDLILPYLDDALNAEIRTRDMGPKFKQGRIGDGLGAGLDRIAKCLVNVPAVPESTEKKTVDAADETEKISAPSETESKKTAENKESSGQSAAGGAGSGGGKPPENGDKPPKVSWWRDFKAWNRAMLRGDRSLGVTALYGASMGAGLYYLWQGLKWSFWTAVFAYLLWRGWKWLRANYWPDEEAEWKKEGGRKPPERRKRSKSPQRRGGAQRAKRGIGSQEATRPKKRRRRRGFPTTSRRVFCYGYDDR